jgi:signal transduction histidine kinase
MAGAQARVGACEMTVSHESLAAKGTIAVTMAMTAAIAAITYASSTSEYAALEASARGLMVGAPMGAGLYARGLPRFRAFGDLLIATGAGWFLAGLSASDEELLYSLGRVSGWVVEVGLIYLVLAFPSGTLGRAERALVAAMGLTVALLYLPTALLVEHYPSPSPWTSCGTGCPENGLRLTNDEPGVIEDLVRPLREALTAAIWLAATVVLGRRIRGANHAMRRTLTPVLSVAIFRLVALAAGTGARQVAPDSTVTEAIAWAIALALPGLACVFLVGVFRWRLFIATAMERLATRLRGHSGPAELREALAEAFDDPSLDVVYWLEEPEGHWADASGRPVEPASRGPGMSVTEARDGARRVAAIIHDPALGDDPAFIASATSWATMTLDNHRLSVQTSALLREVLESRARIQAAADDERRRIEHDLHDGAQQRLVTLRIKLELAAEQAADSGGGRAETLRALGREVDEALDEVRSLARGIYPAPLAARGLVEALRSTALRAALPTTVLAGGIGRYSREIESAAYFCCLEAMQNVDKHATGATAAVIELVDDGALIIEVRDDGAGFDVDAAAGGVGMTSMRDRLAAVGGRLTIRSVPGRGTRVTVRIPITTDANGGPDLTAASP